MSTAENRYSAGVASAATTAAGAAYAEMLAGTEKSISIKQIHVTSGSGVVSNVSIARAFAVGTGAAAGYATGVAHVPFGCASGPTARLQAAWSSAPTGYVSKLKSEVLAGSTGASLALWRESFNGALVVEPGQSILLVNQGSGIVGGPLFVNVTWSEGPR